MQIYMIDGAQVSMQMLESNPTGPSKCITAKHQNRTVNLYSIYVSKKYLHKCNHIQAVWAEERSKRNITDWKQIQLIHTVRVSCN